MEDVARLAGVSRTTVSLVLNGKPDHGIPDRTVERIHEAAASLGYRRNAMAAGLRSSTTHTIGLISDVVATTPFAGQMLHGAQEVAWTARKLISVINTEGDPEVEDAAVSQVLERRMDGALWATMYHQVIPRPRGLNGLPLVLLDARTEDGSVPSVVPDDLGGARAAIGHLVEAGHRRIGFINAIDPVPAAALRLQGYREVLAEAGIGADDDLVTKGDGTPGGEQTALRLLALPDRPTAIFCFNDRTAMGVLRAARRLGLTVPGDLSVVGYDNHDVIAPWMDPPLTTVQLPHLEMGRWGTEHLLAIIDGRIPTDEPPVQMRMPCPLVVRASVAPPRG
jgi:LacI family transcriptional regulator